MRGGDLINGSRLHLLELVGDCRFPTELLDKPTNRRNRMGIPLRGQFTPDLLGIAYPVIPALENEGGPGGWGAAVWGWVAWSSGDTDTLRDD